MNILQKIQKLPFMESQYMNVETNKTQIVLHHTVSGDNPKGVAEYWEGTPDRVGTAMIISKDGTPYQIFSSKFWAGHLGLKKATFDSLGLSPLPLDKTSIGIELCNWGGLIYKNGKYYNYYQNEVKNVEIVEYKDKFRDYQFYEKYSDAQIQTVKELIEYWNQRYSIPMEYMGDENVFSLSKDALSGKPGIFGHCSYRLDKSDIHPQKEMIDMLKSLKK